MAALGDYVEPVVMDIAGATVILACRQDVQDPQWAYWKPVGWLWEIAHSADSPVKYPTASSTMWRSGRCVMFGPDKSTRSKSFHTMRMHFPSLISSRSTIVVHCFDGQCHSPLFLAMLLSIHGYSHSLDIALKYLNRLRPVWKGYFDPNEPDYRSCRESFHWAQVTVQSLLAC